MDCNQLLLKKKAALAVAGVVTCGYFIYIKYDHIMKYINNRGGDDNSSSSSDSIILGGFKKTFNFEDGSSVTMQLSGETRRLYYDGIILYPEAHHSVIYNYIKPPTWMLLC